MNRGLKYVLLMTKFDSPQVLSCAVDRPSKIQLLTETNLLAK